MLREKKFKKIQKKKKKKIWAEILKKNFRLTKENFGLKILKLLKNVPDREFRKNDFWPKILEKNFLPKKQIFKSNRSIRSNNEKNERIAIKIFIINCAIRNNRSYSRAANLPVFMYLQN